MTAPVSIVIPTLTPHKAHLARTINSLAEQTTPPAELIIVDVTPGGFPYPTEGEESDCGLCGNVVGVAMDRLREAGASVRVLHRPELGLSEQRRLGIKEAANELVGRFDEDTVLLNPRHIERCVDHLQADEIVGVGCRVEPIRGNPGGKVIAKLLQGSKQVPVGLGHGAYNTAYFLIHKTHLCPDGEACFPVEHRDGDQHLQAHLREHGEVIRDPDLVALTDLPTRKQKRALKVGGAVGTGGLLGGLL